MGRLEKFKRALWSLCPARNETELTNEAIATVISDQIPGATPPERPDAGTEIDKFIVGIDDIHRILSSLRDIEVFLTMFHHGPVSPVRYLRFHIDAYLNLLYLLKERLVRYTRLLERALKARGSEDASAKQLFSDLRERVEHVFSDALRVRGDHVHEKLYRTRNLEFLGILEARSLSDQGAKHHYEAALQRVRQQWLRAIVANNQTAEDLVGEYFEELYSVVFEGAVAFFGTGSGRLTIQ